MIKPQFFRNADLATIAPEARLLFIGLWCMADRRGRLEDCIPKIKIEIMPADPFNIGSLLEMLCEHGLIIRYSVKGNQYIQITNFEKHQYPHVREPESTIPAPGKHYTGTTPEPKPTTKLASTVVPDVEIPPTPEPENPVPANGFELLWAMYPKRVRRKESERHFKASVRTADDWQKIQVALKNYVRSREVREGYIQNGSTWFNNWRDWIDFKGANPTPNSVGSYAGIVHPSYKEAVPKPEDLVPHTDVKNLLATMAKGKAIP